MQKEKRGNRRATKRWRGRSYRAKIKIPSKTNSPNMTHLTGHTLLTQGREAATRCNRKEDAG